MRVKNRLENIGNLNMETRIFLKNIVTKNWEKAFANGKTFDAESNIVEKTRRDNKHIYKHS